MSKKYIDHDAIMEQIAKIKDDFSPAVRPMFDVFKHILSEAPAADVEPVVHGEWIPIRTLEGAIEVKCTNCESNCIFGKVKINYCPNCGARMDRGNSND